LIDLMDIPTIARVAGEAFSMITGVDLSDEHLSGEKPEGFEAGPTEDPEDENVAMDPDENLPWPVAALVAKWWNKHRAQFQTGRRYLKGKEITVQSLRELLLSGNQPERAAAALELALKEPTQPLLEVRARVALQLQVDLQKLIHELAEAQREYDRLVSDEEDEHALGPPASPKQVAKLEDIVGKPLPPSYRAFLELHNGWDDFAGGAKLLSVEDHGRAWVKKRVKDLGDLFFENDSKNPFLNGAIPILLGWVYVESFLAFVLKQNLYLYSLLVPSLGSTAQQLFN
jgi:SMI1 / KNR4 family (SUKH-1)